MIKNKYFVLVFILLISACSKEAPFTVSESVDEQFNIIYQDGYTPIWVRGNVASGKILVFVQGGPAYNSLDYAAIDYPEWKETLEKDYAIAYYDQLGTGMRGGEVDPSSINLEDWLGQLHEVGTVLKQKYGQEIVFMGHSFGGVLVMRYMHKYGYEGVADYYINMDGPATTDADEIRWDFRREFLKNLCDEGLKANTNKAFWKEVEAWLNEHAVIATSDERRQWNVYVESIYDDNFEDKSLDFKNYTRVLFASSYSLGPALLNAKSLEASY